MGSAPIAGPWSGGLIMRKATFVLNIVNAVIMGFSTMTTFFVAPFASATGGGTAHETPDAIEIDAGVAFVQIMFWVAFAICLIDFIVQIFAAAKNKRAISKSGAIAPAILSIIFGGLLGIVAGILLLVADRSEFELAHYIKPNYPKRAAKSPFLYAFFQKNVFFIRLC